MAVDARIPLMGQVQQVPSGARLMSDMLVLRNQRERMKGSQLDNAKRMRDAADHAAIQEAIKANPQDMDAAVQSLRQSGHGSAALLLEEGMGKARTSRAKAHASEMAMMKGMIEMQEHFLAGIHDEDTFQAAKAIIEHLVPTQPGQPSPAAMMGDHYDQAAVDKLVKSLQPVKDRIMSGHYAAQDANKALEIQGLNGRRGAQNEKDKASVDESNAKAAQYWTSFAAHKLSLASNDDEWQKTLRHLKTEGVPASIVEGMPATFSKASIDKVRAMQLTEAQRRRLLREDKDAITRASKEGKVANPNDPKKADPWYERDMSAYRAAQSEWHRSHPSQMIPQKSADGTYKIPPPEPFQSFEEWRKTSGHPPQAPTAAPAAPAAAAPAKALNATKTPMTSYKGPNGIEYKVGDPVTLKDGRTGVFKGIGTGGKPIIDFSAPAAPPPPPQGGQEDGGDETDSYQQSYENGDDEVADTGDEEDDGDEEELPPAPPPELPPDEEE